jgi:hypothetical protein
MIHYFKLRQSSLRLDNNFDKDFQISKHNSVTDILSYWWFLILLFFYF